MFKTPKNSKRLEISWSQPKKIVHKARAALDRHAPEQQNLGIATFLTLAFL
jgi:hypothetical protein